MMDTPAPAVERACRQVLVALRLAATPRSVPELAGTLLLRDLTVRLALATLRTRGHVVADAGRYRLAPRTYTPTTSQLAGGEYL